MCSTRQTMPLTDKRIGVLGKGGAGKSTVVVLLAQAIADHGYHVCVLDADSTNVGIHQAMGLSRSPTPLIEYYGGTVFSGGAVTCPVDDPIALPKAEISLDTLSQEYYVQDPRGVLLLVAGKIGGKGPGAGCDGPVSKIARDLRLRRREEHQVTIVDLKAGMEDSARGVLTSLDWAIVVVDPTNASIQLAADMKQMVEQIKAGVPPATDHLQDPELVEAANRVFREAKIKGVFYVLNRVKDAEMESYMRQRLEEMQMTPVGVIHENASIAMSWLAGTPLDTRFTMKNVKSIVKDIEAAELASRAV
jgi:CO dehydrogenase nickel-insertion accessory protein CooC1